MLAYASLQESGIGTNLGPLLEPFFQKNIYFSKEIYFQNKITFKYNYNIHNIYSQT